METKKTMASDAGKRQGLSFRTRHYGTAQVVTHTYVNGGTLAVELVDEAGESIAMLSVNFAEDSHQLGENEFFAKTWSENESIAEDALASGIFRDTGRMADGILDARIWTFS